MNDRLKELRKTKGLTLEALGEIVGLSKGYLSELESGKKAPSIAVLHALADALGSRASELLEGAETYGEYYGVAKAEIAADLVSVYSVQASAGPGMLNTDESIAEKLAFPPDYLRHITKSHPRNLAIIGCKGDSMSPTLKDDDLVMIDTSKTDLSYEGIFVVKVDEGAALLVKRIGRASRRGYIMLISDNPSHPPVEVAAHEVIPVGKVVWAGVKI